MNRLVLIMDRLLAPGGCPWDREQTLETLRPFLVEETYEVLDALARGDVPGHCEELGDLLMQVVFHAALRREQGAFDFDAVASAISESSYAGTRTCSAQARPRAPEAGELAAAAAVARSRPRPRSSPSAEEIKRAEKAAAGTRTGRILDGVKPGPALSRAEARRQGGQVGFDWPSWEGSFDKIREKWTRSARPRAPGTPPRATPRSAISLFAVVNQPASSAWTPRTRSSTPPPASSAASSSSRTG